MTSEKAPELKERLDMLSEGATPGPYGVESYGSGTTYITLGTWPGHYASDTVPPMGYGRAEIVTTNIPRAWGEVGRKGHTAHFLTELANAYRAGKLVTADVADAMVAAEIANRDAMEEAFSKAYSLVMGQPMEWSSAYNQAEALGDMEERLAADRASGGVAQAMIAAVLSEAVKKAELTFQDIGGGRRPPMPFEALLRDLEGYSQIMPSKARAQNVMRQAAKLLRALTPSEASAALAERDRRTWDAAIDAAMELMQNGVNNASSKADHLDGLERRDFQISSIAHASAKNAIAALKKETQ